MQTTLFETFRKQDRNSKLAKRQMHIFFLCLIGMTLWQFLPEYAFPMTSSLAFLCWVAPKNPVCVCGFILRLIRADKDMQDRQLHWLWPGRHGLHEPQPGLVEHQLEWLVHPHHPILDTDHSISRFRI